MVQKNRAAQMRRRHTRPAGAGPRPRNRPSKSNSDANGKKSGVKFVDVAPKADNMEFDRSAYHVHNRLETGYPCLTFDTIPDRLGRGSQRAEAYPLSFTLVAGNQVPASVKGNTVYVMKVEDIKKLSPEDDDDDEDDDDEDVLDDEQDDGAPKADEKLPKLNLAKISHNGNVNRVRAMQLGERSFAATWSDKSVVYIYDLTLPLQAVNNHHYKKIYMAEKVDPKPVYSFSGHRTEGFALDWCQKEPGTLATGDCNKDIHIWKMQSGLNWNVDQRPLAGHTKSVEDIKWSPEQKNELASCSVDKSIRFWDLRQNGASCVTTMDKCHDSDINVLDWNKLNTNLVISGGDDGIVKTWDRRYLSTSSTTSTPVASFQFHKKPITSIEWHPEDDTVFAASSEDDRVTIWDLAVEPDDEQMDETNGQAQLDQDVDMTEKDTDKMDQDSEDESSSDESSSSDDDYEDDDDDDQEDEEKAQDEGVVYSAAALSELPPQILFVHEGQSEIKEIHWHPQIPGIMITTASDGFNIFRTISA